MLIWEDEFKNGSLILITTQIIGFHFSNLNYLKGVSLFILNSVSKSSKIIQWILNYLLLFVSLWKDSIYC